MTNEEQRKIFSKNLRYYIGINDKQQKDVAKDLKVNPTTLNMWCTGKSMPKVSMIQKLADYFLIGKSDLIDDKLDGNPRLDAKILTDTEAIAMMDDFYKLSADDRKLVRELIGSLSKKTAEINSAVL